MTNVINSLKVGDGTYVFTTPYAICETAGITTAKVAIITPGSNFSLETGARVAVKFTNANAAGSPTLNVSNTGAKPIYFKNAALSSSNYWSDGQIIDFIYDGTNWVCSAVVTDTNTDTKNTAGSTDTSSKIFLIGATSQAANPQTYSHDTAYVDTDGCLYSNSQKVATLGDLTNYVTIDTAQTITGIKTFNAPTDVSGKETITTKFETSNGGALIIGKEGQNSGTMLRFDQVDGTCRLRFRASATAGAMVWEQPEENASLYFDMGNSAGSGVNRVTLRNEAGTLALTTELPAAVSANPTLSGSETELTGLQIGSAKYKIVTQTYVDNAIGNIDTLLTALNSGTGV